jgi:predicted nuclease of predicted toxin-antitoxin system
MKFGERLLFSLCRHVLITDLTWRPYERILCHEQPKRSRRITKIALRRDLFRRQPSAKEIVERIAAAFRENHCDGLFLPLVDCFGVKLPVAEIVARIRAENELRFVAVDGAQAINHVPIRLASDYCDFLVAGCHKWLHSFTPMGVGFFGRRQTVDYIESSLARWSNQRIIDDPLLTFTRELESGRARRFGESVVVSPMITANAAITDAVSEPENVEVISENRRTIGSIVTCDEDWSRLSAGDEATSRIMMLRCRKTQERELSPAALRRRFHASRIAVSTYRRGRVRISVPGSPLRFDDIRRLESAFSGFNAISA